MWQGENVGPADSGSPWKGRKGRGSLPPPRGVVLGPEPVGRVVGAPVGVGQLLVSFWR